MFYQLKQSKSTTHSKTYCTRSASGPPCVMGHSVFYGLHRVFMFNVMGWFNKTTSSLVWDRILCHQIDSLTSNGGLITAELVICSIWEDHRCDQMRKSPATCSSLFQICWNLVSAFPSSLGPPFCIPFGWLCIQWPSISIAFSQTGSNFIPDGLHSTTPMGLGWQCTYCSFWCSDHTDIMCHEHHPLYF